MAGGELRDLFLVGHVGRDGLHPAALPEQLGGGRLKAAG